MREDFEYTEKSRGQSRARGQSHARGASSRSGSRSSAGSHSSGYTGPRSSGSRSSYAGGSRSTAGAGSRSSSRSTGSSGRRGSDYGRKSQDGPNMKFVLGAVLLFLVVGGALVFAVRGGFVGGAQESSAVAEETTQNVLYTDTDTIHKDITLDLSALSPEVKSLNLNGMNRESVKQAIQDAYSWNLVVKNANPSIDSFKMPDLSIYDAPKETADADAGTDNDGTAQKVDVDNPYASVTIRPEATSFSVPDLIEPQIDALVEQIFTDYKAKIAEESASASAGSETSERAAESTEASEAESESEGTTSAGNRYTLELQDMSAQISDYMKQLAIVWKMSPKNGDITSYDKESGEFVFGGSVAGYAVNAEATAQKLMASIEQHVYDASIACEGEKISASDSSIRDLYGTISSFTTKTTSNATRNKNVKLAAAAINGTVLQPGEEFSFNKTVGQRTEAKGYGAAAAYNNGEVVQEIGGGVCQVSSTLYNAVFRSGLTTTYRRSHTFAPTYVTPGADATVSWQGPDYQFINDSDHAIGIRAWYEDQTCTVQIYGVRVLPKGESWELVCEKTADLPIPAPKIITPEEGAESAGSAGSEWVAYKLIHKADGTTEKMKDHGARYSGHAPKQYAPGTTESTAESSIAESGESTAESGSTAETTISENGPKPSTDETKSGTSETKTAPTPETSPAETAKKPEAPTPETGSSHEVIEAPGAAEGPDSDDIIQDGP